MSDQSVEFDSRRRIPVVEGMTEAFIALDPDFRLTYINAAGEHLLGSDRETLLGREIWSAYPLRGTVAEPACRRAMSERVATRFELFFEPRRRWFDVNVDPSDSGGLAVYFRDVTERRRHATILNGQKRALELAVHDAPVGAVLDVLVRTVEQHSSDGVMASILLLDADGIHVRRGAAPSLPEEYSRALDGLAIGPAAGSCGTAAYHRRRVIVTDIETDPLWDDYRALAVKHGLKSCWSTPILSARGAVLGTFALYHRKVFTPEPRDLEVVDLLTHTAAVVIERHRETERRQAAEKNLALQIEGLERLHSLAMLLPRLPSLKPKLDAILKTAMEVHGAGGGILCVYDETRDALEACSTAGLDEAVVTRLLHRDSQGAASIRAFSRRSRIVIEDVEADEEFSSLRETARAGGFRAVHSTPIVMRTGETIGVLTLHFPRPFEPTDLHMRLADLCAAHAADAISAERRERALRESEENFRHLADNMSQFAWMADGDGSIFWYNQRWFDYTGATLEQMKGWGWAAVHHPDHVDRVVRKIRHSFETGEPWEDTFPLRGKDGRYRWFLSRAVPVRDSRGRVTRWFGTNTDITAIRETEMELQKAKDVAEEANRAKDQFLAMLGHELRNPLAPIVTALELAKLRGDDRSGELGVMERQVQHIIRLVEDLLDLARFRSGKVALVRERVHLADVVSRAMEMAGPLVAEKKHDVTIDVPEEGLTLDGDPIRLAQIAANLISNAAKYTDPEGRIAIRGRLEDGMVVLSVQDNGIGLEPDAVEQVFEEFVQEREALSKSRGGLGLGLAIVRKLVEMHGGTVQARSAGRGQGSEFTVRFPAAAPRDVSKEVRPAPAATSVSRSSRVLIIDDNEDAAVLLRHTLQRMGFTVAVALDGADALRVAAEFHPDVALVDLNLPRISGYELAPRLRALPEMENVRLVAATGHGEDSARKRSAEAGFDAHLVKPIGIRTLANTLDALLH